MSHSNLLGLQITAVVFIGLNDDGDVLHNLQSVAFQSHTFYGIVGDKLYLANTHLLKNLSTYTVFALIGLEAKMYVGINGIVTFFL